MDKASKKGKMLRSSTGRWCQAFEHVGTSGGERSRKSRSHHPSTRRCSKLVAGRASASLTGKDSSGKNSQRSVLILPGLGNNAGDYDELVADLVKRSEGALHVSTVDVARLDWFRNVAGLTTSDYWKGTLKPRPTLDWYLTKVQKKIEEAQEETGGGPITFVGHSAGGWLGRTYLAEVQPPLEAKVDCFISLGSPQLAPPKDASGIVDQTRGILTWVNEASPGAYHEDVKYISICSKCIKGAKLNAEGATIEEKITGQGYKQVCGNADVWGDGIVPLPSAHLDGALQIDYEGIYHSPIGRGDRPWYGSSEVVDKWFQYIYVSQNV